MPRYKHCQTCKDPNVSFENKFCSIECADLYDGMKINQWASKIDLK